MFDQIVKVSDAFHQGASQMQGSLRMAMKGCSHCGTMQVIASPELGTCADCGSELEVLSASEA